MKKLLLLCVMSLACCYAYSQLIGDFYKIKNTGQIFFSLDNPSPYPIPIKWKLLNLMKNEKGKIIAQYSHMVDWHLDPILDGGGKKVSSFILNQ